MCADRHGRTNGEDSPPPHAIEALTPWQAESLGLHRAADDLTSSGLDLVLKDEQQMRQQTWTGCLIADRCALSCIGQWEEPD